MVKEDYGKTALVLQGGGARGAYQVGVLKAIAQITGARRSPFQIVCGASAGAINAAPVAVMAQDFQVAVRHLEKLWRGLHCTSIYETIPLTALLSSSRLAGTLLSRFGRTRTGGSLLDHTPLRKLLEREFNRERLDQAISSGALHALCVTASSYSHGVAVTFFDGAEGVADWHRARRLGRRVSIGPAHLLASASLPFAFDPVEIGDEYFGDGSLRSTSPLSPAIRTGADRVLVIATRDPSLQVSPQELPTAPPTFGDIAGHALDILFNDNFEADYERMLRINETLSIMSRDQRQNARLRPISALLLAPSTDLRDIARPHSGDLPRTIRLLMKMLGAWDHDGRLESYLMFEPAYIGDLIDRGYADTIARRDELASFLAD
ncbi:patatin-like phospholipase family protein [Sulfitobacter sp. S0837]|uniref:patatin-like phospholipase family protein n=1 Tax=Sulfitobacter maritimus TaxID=2741719 RepID=UPI0015841EBE|nr:patatin-like phospholipase family protein [Sulfitobacter maritimus]NUH66422.1 patatin-like phospholipase family protein [Sulfitobacter maritimus]